MILLMVHQRGTGLDVRCTSGVMGGNVTVQSVVSSLSFSFPFHLNISLLLIPVLSYELRLACYIHFSFTLSEAAHLT